MPAWLGRLALILSLLLVPFALLGVTDALRDAVASATTSHRASMGEPASMSPASDDDDTPEDGASAQEDDDGAGILEPALSTTPPRVPPAGKSGPVRFRAHAEAAWSTVHLDVQTPPPRA